MKEREHYRLAENIQWRREAEDWSRAELGEKIKISGQAIGQFERGVKHPNSITLGALADAFGITVDELMYGSGRDSVRGA